MARHEDRGCPTCGAGMTPVVYGLPGLELAEAAARGDVELGGCTIEFDGPNLICRGAERHPWRYGADGDLVPTAAD